MGLREQFYNFLQNLLGEGPGAEQRRPLRFGSGVELEMNPDDQRGP